MLNREWLVRGVLRQLKLRHGHLEGTNDDEAVGSEDIQIIMEILSQSKFKNMMEIRGFFRIYFFGGFLSNINC